MDELVEMRQRVAELEAADTEWVWAERALQESEEKYRTMIEQSNDMIWTLDTEGNFTFFNRRSEEISGHRFEDWRGKSFAPLIVEEDMPLVADVFRRTLNGEPLRYEVRVKKEAGSGVRQGGPTTGSCRGAHEHRPNADPNRDFDQHANSHANPDLYTDPNGHVNGGWHPDADPDQHPNGDSNGHDYDGHCHTYSDGHTYGDRSYAFVLVSAARLQRLRLSSYGE